VDELADLAVVTKKWEFVLCYSSYLNGFGVHLLQTQIRFCTYHRSLIIVIAFP
jgi:hypothetical protein